MPDRAPWHRISRQHLHAMTGELGIFQHASGSRPDHAHGHCVDDVARALEVDLLHARGLGWAAVAGSANRNLRFLEEAFDPETDRFRNFRSIDGTWIGGAGSDDCQGRAMLALGETLDAAPDVRFLERAGILFGRALPAAATVSALRAKASVLLACVAVVRSVGLPGDEATGGPALKDAAEDSLRRISAGLHARFLDATPDWPWPERSLTYENALLPRALIAAGHRTADHRMLATGLHVLDWLIDAQTSPEGHFSPVGNGWWPRGGAKSQFDQQPIEATALLLAAEAAHAATGDPRYLAAMELAYAWFLGANDLGQQIADPARGASKDGLTSSGVNANEGAESTLVWLMAAERIRRMRSRTTAVHPIAAPGPAIRRMARVARPVPAASTQAAVAPAKARAAAPAGLPG